MSSARLPSVAATTLGGGFRAAVGMRARPEDLGPALRKALAADRPVLLEVVIPNLMPPFQIVR